MNPMSDSAYYEGSTPSQSRASVSQQIFSSDISPPPQLLQLQTSAMPSTNIITCPLCQEIFLEPVVFSCGHTFCLVCSEKVRKLQRVCPQPGCDKPLGEAVPNLLVKEAVISHHARKSRESDQQQALAFQLADLQEATQSHPSTTRYIPNRAFERGARGRRTEIHRMPSQPVLSKRRSLKAMFFGRPKEGVPEGSTEDLALGKRMNQEKWDEVWMGDEQQHESRESSDLASHPMNKFIQAKKDKSLWSKTKYIFSSNKAKK